MASARKQINAAIDQKNPREIQAILNEDASVLADGKVLSAIIKSGSETCFTVVSDFIKTRVDLNSPEWSQLRTTCLEELSSAFKQKRSEVIVSLLKAGVPVIDRYFEIDQFTFRGNAGEMTHNVKLSPLSYAAYRHASKLYFFDLLINAGCQLDDSNSNCYYDADGKAHSLITLRNWIKDQGSLDYQARLVKADKFAISDADMSRFGSTQMAWLAEQVLDAICLLQDNYQSLPLLLTSWEKFEEFVLKKLLAELMVKHKQTSTGNPAQNASFARLCSTIQYLSSQKNVDLSRGLPLDPSASYSPFDSFAKQIIACYERKLKVFYLSDAMTRMLTECKDTAAGLKLSSPDRRYKTNPQHLGKIRDYISEKLKPNSTFNDKFMFIKQCMFWMDQALESTPSDRHPLTTQFYENQKQALEWFLKSAPLQILSTPIVLLLLPPPLPATNPSAPFMSQLQSIPGSYNMSYSMLLPALTATTPSQPPQPSPSHPTNPASPPVTAPAITVEQHESLVPRTITPPASVVSTAEFDRQIGELPPVPGQQSEKAAAPAPYRAASATPQ